MLSPAVTMGQNARRPWIALVVAGGGALLVLVLVSLMMSRELGEAPLPSATPIPPTPADPAVISVNGQAIGRSSWQQAVLVDQVMSGLAGVPAPAPEETLERLINDLLVLQAVPQESPPSDDLIDLTIGGLTDQWGVDDGQVAGALEGAGLTWEALESTVAWMLMVQRAQQALQERGLSIAEWLAEERAGAEIVVQPGLSDAFLPTPAPSPVSGATPSPLPGLGAAPDFTLQQAGGGDFTLSAQLAHGPVVLVFFQRCG